MKSVSFLLAQLLVGSACAQSGGPWAIKSSTIDGGGQRSSGGAWALTGTIGQPDATAVPSTGGGFAIAGGFWPVFIAAPGGPAPTISRLSATHVRISWTTAAVGYKLQTSSNLTNWTDLPMVISAASFFDVAISSGPRRCFRLKKL